MRAWVGTLSAALALSACASKPPAFWDAACANETGEIRHETPAPDGLAVPSGVYGFAALVLTGAEWVEFDETAVFDRFAAVFHEEPGRYRLRLARLAEPECRQALQLEGYDPVTRVWNRDRAAAAFYEGALIACAEAEWIGALGGPSSSAGMPPGP